MKRDLAYWRALDQRVKARLDQVPDVKLPGVPTVGFEPWLARQIALVLAGPLLLTPVVTKILYPWLPQPDANAYLLTGVGGLAMALAANEGYKKAQHEAREHSATPSARGKAP